ncbi:DUF998 domain-containing protein [Brevibacterium sp.]|uniref:DUF998 domain-containing protein n=1 Tax=Brevibacterium sp. TaxID=1701 RepID=UPI00281160F5|nr:DUF998 domain-containing protein [Brevibacterium sp.]
MRRTIGILLAAGVVIAYDTWVLLFLSPHPRPLSGYLSELAAADQPYDWVFRGGDMTAGALMILIACLGWTGWRSCLGRLSPAVAAALALTGLATICDAAAAMPCAESFDDACHAAHQADPLQPGFLIHTVTSTVVVCSALATMVLVHLALRRRGGRHTVHARWVVVIAAVLLASNLASWLIEMLWRSGQGYVQVVGVIIIAGWVSLLGYSAVTHPRIETSTDAYAEAREGGEGCHPRAH